jgi:hypothetical protein
MFEGIKRQLATLKKVITEARQAITGHDWGAALLAVRREDETTDQAINRCLDETGPVGSETRWRPHVTNGLPAPIIVINPVRVGDIDRPKPIDDFS